MPDLTFDQKFKTLPPFVQEWMAREESAKINSEIAQKYGLKPEQTGKMVWLISRTIIGDIKPEEFLGKFKEQFPNLDDEILRQMTLEIATSRFYPIRDFLKGAEALIKNLGGEVSEDGELYSKQYEEKVRSLKSEVGSMKLEGGREEERTTGKLEAAANEQLNYVGVSELLEKYSSIQNQFITSQPIKLQDKEQPVNATLSNWLKDYRDKKGAPPHSSMERTDYLFNSENTSRLDNSERTILGNVLKAYDEGGELPIDKNSGKLVLSELFRQDIALQPPSPKKTVKLAERKIIQPNNIVDLRKNNS